MDSSESDRGSEREDDIEEQENGSEQSENEENENDNESEGNEEQEDEDDKLPEDEHMIAIKENKSTVYTTRTLSYLASAVSNLFAQRVSELDEYDNGVRNLESLKKEELKTKSEALAKDKKKNALPPPRKLTKEEKEKRKLQGTGAEWYHMKTPELTPELKLDLEVLSMKHLLDPTTNYRAPKELPKVFEVGYEINSALDYHTRPTKKVRKASFVDDILQNREYKKFLESKAQKSRKTMKPYGSSFKRKDKDKKKGNNKK
eukprot:TRINITY_DN269_c1_g3_i1.p1 TRINITY_DN269_c1_g3~~TRINITY_DN269_c1_g3_i1.p1  ORF type:complete len:260 (-),score=73.46 TRINITY_DN269_c1_g3_i1:46-825(-)